MLCFFHYINFFVIKKFEGFKKRVKSKFEVAICDVLFKQKKLKKH